MQHRSLLMILSTTVLLGFLVTSVDAQSTNRFEVDVPFQFVVSGRILPAGNYAIGRADSGNPKVLILKNLDNGIMRAILCQRVEKETPSTTAFLLFTQTEGKFFLTEVWDQGSLSGNQLPVQKTKRRRHDEKSLAVQAIQHRRQ